MADTRTSGQPPRATNAFGCRSPRKHHYTPWYDRAPRGCIRAGRPGPDAGGRGAVDRRAQAVLPAGVRALRAPTCLAIILRPEQLDLLPAALNGLDDPRRRAAGRRRRRWTARAASARRGGRAGVRLHGLDATAARPLDLSATSTVVLDVRDARQPLDALVFALRTAATAIRRCGSDAAADRRRGAVDRARRAPDARGSGLLGCRARRSGAAGWQSGGVLTGALAALRAAQPRPGRLMLTAGSDDRDRRGSAGGPCARRRWLDDVAHPGRRRSTGRVRRRRRCSRLSRSRLARPHRSARGVCPADRPVVVRADAPGRAASAARRAAHSSGWPSRPRDRFADETQRRRPRGADRRGDRRAAPGGRRAAGGRRSATLISTGTLTVTFEAPGFPAPVTVAVATTIYTERRPHRSRAARHPRQRRRASRQRRHAAAADHRARARRGAAAGHHARRRYRYRLDGRGDGRRRRAATSSPSSRATRGAAVRGAPGSHATTSAWCGSRRRRPALGGRSSSSEQTDEFTPRRRRAVAAGAVGRPADLRRRGVPHADSPRAGARRRTRSTRRTSTRAAPTPTRRDHVMLRDTPDGLPLRRRRGRAAAATGARSADAGIVRAGPRAGRRRRASARSPSASSSIRTSRSRCRLPA